MYQKVMNMVNDNYRVDLTQKKKEGISYYESLEFTNHHAKLLMLISIFIRIFIPMVMHYISTMKSKSENAHLIEYYRPIFDIVEENEHVNLYQKLFNSINVSVQLSYKKNKIITRADIWVRDREWVIGILVVLQRHVGGDSTFFLTLCAAKNNFWAS